MLACQVRANRNPLLTLPRDVLVVVSCTSTKVWATSLDAPQFVPACQAYRGTSFLTFLRHLEEAVRAGKGDLRWLILSAKYGYIEPGQPIDNYDVTFSVPATGPISDETLFAQVMYQARWPDQRAIRDFSGVRYSGDEVYGDRTRSSFRNTGLVVEPLAAC